MAPDDVAARVAAAPAGLSSPEAARRLAQYGPNEARESPGVTRLGVLWSQLRSPLLLLLLFAAAVSILTGEWTDAVIVLAIVVASVGIRLHTGVPCPDCR